MVAMALADAECKFHLVHVTDQTYVVNQCTGEDHWLPGLARFVFSASGQGRLNFEGGGGQPYLHTVFSKLLAKRDEKLVVLDRAHKTVTDHEEVLRTDTFEYHRVAADGGDEFLAKVSVRAAPKDGQRLWWQVREFQAPRETLKLSVVVSIASLHRPPSPKRAPGAAAAEWTADEFIGRPVTAEAVAPGCRYHRDSGAPEASRVHIR